MRRRRLLWYSGLAAVTAPVWVPLAWLGKLTYTVGRPSVRLAFRRPVATAIALTLGGMLVHTTCAHREQIGITAGQLYQGIVEYEAPARVEESPEHSHAFYFVKPGDTLSAISSKIAGTPELHDEIATDNHIDDPRALMAGQLLSLRKEFCTEYNPDVYERVPPLESVILAGHVRVSERFPHTWQEVLQFNRQLGLRYEDTFPHRNGARVIYFRE